MKKFLKPHARVLAFILSVAIVFTCSYVGISSMAAADTFMGFLEGQGTVEDQSDGSHLITFNHGYTAVTSNYKIDLTKGFKWNFVNAQWAVRFSFKKSFDAAAVPFNFTKLLSSGESATDILFYPTGYGLGITSRVGYTGLNSNAGSSNTSELKLKFQKEVMEGQVYYRLYINGIADYICYPEATFKDLNNYNASEEKFEGAHLGVSVEHAPLSLTVSPFVDKESEVKGDTFIGFNEGAGTVEDRTDGSHLINFSHGYSGVTSNYKIDLSKGFKWNFVNAQFGVHFSFKKSFDEAATPFNFTWLLTSGESATDILFYPQNSSTIGISTRNGYTGLNSSANSASTAELEVKFLKETLDGIVCYRLYINGVADFICFPEETFNNLNNYNATTGKFEGAHIGVSIENTPLSIAIAPVKDKASGAEGDTFEFGHSSNGTVYIRDNGWNDIVFNMTYARATSNYKIDLTRGFKWQYTDAFWGLHFSFLKSADAQPSPFRMTWILNDTDVATDLLFYPDEGRNKVGIATRYDFTGLNDWKGNSPTDLLEMKFKKEILANEVYYRLYINDEGAYICYSEAEFNELNNYNTETGKFEGCYLSVFSEGGAGAFGLYANRDTIPTDRPFVGTNCTVAQTKAPYKLTIDASKAAKSTFTMDLVKGFSFNLSDWPKSGCNWVTVGMAGSYWLMNMEADGSDENTYSIKLNNENGKIVAKMGNSTPTSTGLSITEDHTVSFKYEGGAVDGYRAYIDDVPLQGDGSVIPVDKFKEVNNYYSETDKFSGAFIRFASDSVFTIKNIKGITPAEKFVNTTAGFSYQYSNGIYDMTYSGEDTATATWGTDLTKGILFKLNELTNNADEYVELAFMGSYDDNTSTFGKSIRLRQKDGRLYASVWDGSTESLETDFTTPFNETHILKATPITSMGITTYRITIDGRDFAGLFSIKESDFKKFTNFNKATISFNGANIKITASGGAEISAFAPADEAFANEEGVYYSLINNKYNLDLNDKQSAVSTFRIDLLEGIAFTINELNDIFSIKLANSLWDMSNNVAANTQPILKLKNVDGKLNVSLSNDFNVDKYIPINSKIAGEHIIEAKKATVAGVGDVYKIYFDGVDINSKHYLTAEQFSSLNSYDAMADTYSGAVFRMAAEKAISIQNICVAVPFEGTSSFSYSEPTKDHYNLSFVGTSYERAVSRWKTDLTAGLSFNVTNASGWIMLRFANTFDGMYREIPGTKSNTYQPMIRIEQWFDGSILTSIKIGEVDRYITNLDNYSLTGTHVLTAKLVQDDRTGVMVYKLFLDGMEICKGFTMSQGIFKKINGYNSDNGTFDGANILFASQNGATLENVHELTVGETVEKNDWDTNTNADVVKAKENVYNLNMKAFSSLRAEKAVNMDKGMTFTAESAASDLQFGLAFSMLPEGVLLDVPPIISDEYGMYFNFAKNQDNTYSIRSTTGLYATYNGDLSGKHTYSFVKIKDKNGEDKYTLAIDGKAVFDDGMSTTTYLMLTNASKGSYPTIFTKSDLVIKNLTGEFSEKVIINTDNLWDEDLEFEMEEDEELEEDFFEDDIFDGYEEDEEFEESKEEEEEEPRTERVLVKRVKIKQEPIVSYVMNWWRVIIAITAVGLVVGVVITFVPFKKKDKKD